VQVLLQAVLGVQLPTQFVAKGGGDGDGDGGDPAKLQQ
jgi:hypothetical protein